MKVKELIQILNQCDSNAEISVLFPLPNRPTGGTLEPIFNIKPFIDQDSNETHYVIDTGIGEEKRYKTFLKN